VVLDRDSIFESNQLRLKIQGVQRLIRIRRFLPRRPGNFLIEVFARDDGHVVLAAEFRVLGLVEYQEYEVRPGEANDQAREILEVILDFIWRCSPAARGAED
jgi:hypothetical protein